MRWTIIHSRIKTDAALSASMKYLILYDGECLLCNGFIRRLLQRTDDTVRAAALQHYPHHALLPVIDERIDSIVLIEGQQVFYKSDAVLRVTSQYGPYRLLSRLAFIVPRFLRNTVYDVVARNRYNWFGKSDNCLLPEPSLRAKYLTTEQAIMDFLQSSAEV